MNDQREKTALELVDELDRYLTNGPLGCHDHTATNLIRSVKSAIERERDASEITIDGLEELVKSHTQTIQEMNDRLKSAIVMRPIAELPDRVPDGHTVVQLNSGWVITASTDEVRHLGRSSDATHFYILPLPKSARRLHPCYMPGCGGKASIFVSIDGDGYFVHCDKCEATGPVRADKDAAKQAWGYE